MQARRIALALDLLEQITLEDVVQPDGAGLQVELEQGEVGQAFGQGLGVEIVEPPQGRGGREGDVGVLGEDPQLAVMAALVLVVEELEADLDDAPDRMPTLGLVATIEDRHPLFLIALLDRGQGLGEGSAPVHQLVQRPPGQLEQLRPLAQPPRQVAEAVRVGLHRNSPELVAEQVDRFVGGHLVNLDRLRLEGQGEIEAPGREQPGAAPAASEERVEVGLPPDVVDDDQGGLVLQPRGELLRRLLDAGEAGLLAGQGLIRRRQAAEDVGNCWPSSTQRMPSVKASMMSSSWHRAWASVVLPKPPAPCRAVAMATGFSRLSSSSRRGAPRTPSCAGRMSREGPGPGTAPVPAARDGS